MRAHVLPLVATALLMSAACQADNDAPPLAGSSWIGTPVSLNAVKGNATVLVFWNFDTPC
ncbi:MAG: hypothetical protein ABSE73_26405 [Planctomycetota bacterium]